MKQMKIMFILSIVIPWSLFAQGTRQHVTGSVYGLEFHGSHQDTIALIHANVYWLNTGIGVVTDEEGRFRLPIAPLPHRLVVGHVGYESDTLMVETNASSLNIFLHPKGSREEVTIQAAKPHTLHLHEAAVNTQTITQEGLRTLACCNLAESFENTNSVDVEQTDAVSGAKRIKMLGLAGFYTQILVEKNPMMRGLISPFALEYIPGFWIDAIDISKGTASVVSGYESTTGQINVELKKPETTVPLELNAYQSNMGRSELTIAAARRAGENLHTMLLGYASYNQLRMDEDADTFLDMPLVKHLSLMNRWRYSTSQRDAQIGFKVLHDVRDGGQMDFDFSRPNASQKLYGSRNRIKRYEFFSKAGTLLSDHGSSLGLIVSGFKHRQSSFWGMKTYDGDESSLYANLIFETSSEHHSVSSGLSYLIDDREENYQNIRQQTSERVPGVFLEYTYKQANRWTALAGFRYDHHNIFGSFYTPRFHLKYQPDAITSLRFSAGKGYRVPHVLIDHPAIFTSSRQLVYLESPGAEEAWNAGLQLIRDFTLGADRPGKVVVDFYRTEFQNQVVVDLEQEAQKILIYNLDGRSFSNSSQIEVTATPVKGLDVTLSYRYNDVKTTYMGRLQSLPLNPRHKGLAVFSYTLPNRKWQWDFTTQFNGSTRLPNTEMNPPDYRLPKYSPDHVLLFAQVTRKFKAVQLYAGVENLTDYRQRQPILAWREPFSPYFDSSMIWGPTVGRRFYVGLRHTIL